MIIVTVLANKIEMLFIKYIKGINNKMNQQQHDLILMKLIPDKMKLLPEDIIYHVIGTYLSLDQIHKTIVYHKYFKRANIDNTLKKIGPYDLVDVVSYNALKSIIICLQINAAIDRMNKRRGKKIYTPLENQRFESTLAIKFNTTLF